MSAIINSNVYGIAIHTCDIEDTLASLEFLRSLRCDLCESYLIVSSIPPALQPLHPPLTSIRSSQSVTVMYH